MPLFAAFEEGEVKAACRLADCELTGDFRRRR